MRSLFTRYASIAVALCLAAAAAYSREKSPGSPEFTPRIIGGSKAQHGEYPWMAALIRAEASDRAEGHFCGATLIHPYWVLTAAHCADGPDTEEIEVVVGVTDLDSSQGTTRSATGVVKHPGFYLYTGLNNDLALVRLDNPVNDIPVLPIIDDPSLATPGTEAWALGWGNTSSNLENLTHPAELREVMLPIVSAATANTPANYDGHVDEDMIPAGYNTSGRSACFGDSGGPHLVRDASGSGWVQAGIASWGDDCGQGVPYGVYTRLTYFHDWIQSIISSGYERWLDRQGIIDEALNQGGYDAATFLQYAFSEDATGAATDSQPRPVTARVNALEYPAIRFRRRFHREELHYAVEYSNDLKTWIELHVTNNLVSAPQLMGDGFEEVIYRANTAMGSSTRHFMRVAAKPVSAFASAAYEISILDFQHGLLTRGNRTDPDRPDAGIYIQDYHLLDPIPGQTLIVAADGGSSLLVKTIDAATGEVLHSSSVNLGEFEAAVTFTPEGGREYTIRVTTTTFRSSTPYRVFTFPQYSGPSLGLLDSKDGSISTSDDIFRTYGYRIDNYRLDPGSINRDIRITLQAGGFDSMIYIFDAATGDIIRVADHEPEGDTETLLFRVESGKSYLIGVTHYLESETGSYMLKTQSYAQPAGVYTPSTAQGFFTVTDDSVSEMGRRYYYDIYRLYGAISNRSIRVKVEGHTDSVAAVGVFDRNTFDLLAEASPNYRGISELTFYARSGHQYELLVATIEEYLGGNYILSTSFN